MRQEIFDAIADASAVVMVVTPDWVESTYCRQECDHALHLRKRFIPLLVRGVDESKVPPQLGNINWIRFDTFPFEKGVVELLRAFTLDLDRLHTHVRLYRRPETWSSFRGRIVDHKACMQWLDASSIMLIRNSRGPRSSSQACSLVSHCASSPTGDRRGRHTWIFSMLCCWARHSWPSIMQVRTVSRPA